MKSLLRPSRFARFADFEVDLEAGELRKDGHRIRLQQQPFQILTLLLERPGRVVTREELQKLLWPNDTIVEFEHSINAAINRLREALCDSADEPRYVETLPRRGYRFIAPVETAGGVAQGESPPRPYKAVALGAGIIVAALVVVFALNVAGLRDRVLRAVGVVREPPLHIQSIAVLPLENLSRDPEQEYFADGMTDALITTLGKIGSLRVISRTSVMRFKGARPAGGLAEIAQKLNVDAVVEGSVMRSGDRVRITANLLDAHSDRHLWAESYERDLRDVLALQGEIARAIVSEVKAKVTPDVQARLTRARPVNPAAYEAYLKGHHLQILDSAKAVEFLQRAMQIDPTWAPAHAAMVTPALFLGRTPMEGCAKARAAAGKALELDNTLSEAHSALALVRYQCDWDWPGAEREYKRAIELDPTNSNARHFYSHYLIAMRRFDESLIESKRALEWDPLSEVLNFHLVWHYVFTHQPDLAIEQGRKVLEVWPDSGQGHMYLVS